METKSIPKYSLQNHPKSEEFWAVKIDDGLYEGLVYTYGEVYFDQDDPNDTKLHFEINVLEDLEYDVLSLEGDKEIEFRSTVGDILVELIEESLEHHENRNDNTEASDSQ